MAFDARDEHGDAAPVGVVVVAQFVEQVAFFELEGNEDVRGGDGGKEEAALGQRGRVQKAMMKPSMRGWRTSR